MVVKQKSLPIQDESEGLRQLVYDWDMRLIMNEERLQTIEQVRQFLEGSEAVELRGLTAKEKYYWIEEVLIRFRYHRLKREEKGVIRRYIQKVTGYSRSQVSRSGVILLAGTDELHGYLSGPATKRAMGRECEVYGYTEFGNISRISIAHLYNL